MTWVVFLRGANVGGSRTFLPSAFAKEMADFGLVNLGAAGTFVARTSVTESRLRRAFVERLPFETDLVICPGSEILDLLRSERVGPVPTGAKATVTVLVEAVPRPPRLPLYVPNEAAWEAKITAAHGRFLLGMYRRLNGRLVYPNAVVERTFGVGATTRGWSTFEAIGKLLAAK